MRFCGLPCQAIPILKTDAEVGDAERLREHGRQCSIVAASAQR